MIRGEKIMLAVTSTGCTEAGHFRIDSSEIAGELAMTVTRTAPDFCKMAPTVIEIELTLPEPLRGKDFRVQNVFGRGLRPSPV